MAHRWDPDSYLRYADERGRPFLQLLARVDATDPAVVVDLGCGAGNLTRLLSERWPAARVSGLDSSPEMVARAREAGVEAEVADLRTWVAPDPLALREPVDVLVSNATLQWVPGHLDLLPGLVDRVAPDGWLAFGVPGNFDQPSHTLRRDLAAEPPYAAHTRDVAVPAAHDAATYLRRLQDLGCAVDAWETTYLHVLHGVDPVFEWVSATGARPTLQALPPDLRERFADEFRQRLREAYPDHGNGVLMPFRRVFVVAHRNGGGRS